MDTNVIKKNRYSSANRMSDEVAYYYMEDNLNEVCLSYLVAGKEIESC